MKIKTTLLVIAILTSISCNALNYFWVGGSGSWSDFNNHWATTSSGNIFHNQVPQSTDNVYFDANSFSSSGQTVTIDQTVVICADMNWTGVTHNPTFYGDYTTTLTIYGSLKFVTGMTFNFAGQISFEATTTGKTITTAGILINTSLTFNGIGGGYTLQDALTCNYAIYLNNGTLNTNNQTVNIGSFFSTSNSTRVLNMGSSIFNLTNPWDMLWYITHTGMTLNSGTSVINVVTTFGDAYFAGGGFTYNNLSFTQGANGIIYDNNIFNDVFFANNGTTNGGTFHDVSFAGNAYINNCTFNNVTIAKDGDIQGNNSFNDLTFSAGYTYTLQSGNTQTINNSLTVNGNCGALINILKSSTPGSQATISKASGVVTVSFVTLKDINATGGGTFIANNAIDLGNNTGWTINTLPSKNLYWVGNAGNWDDGNHWSTTSGGLPSGCSPTPVDNVFFDANSFSQTGQTLTVNAPTAYCYNMDWTGVTNNPTISGINTLKIYGSLTLASAMTFNFGGILSFEATTTGHTITTAGVLINTSLTFNGSGGGWALQDDLTTPYLIYLNKGSLNTNNQTVNAAGLWSNVTTPRAITTGTSTFNLSDETMWYIYPAGISINASGSTINGTSTVVAQHFHGSGFTYYDLFFTGGTSGNIYGNNTFHNVSFAGNAFIYGSTFNNVTMAKEGEINASNTFNNLTLSPGYTYTLQANQTQTILSSLTVNGNCGALINILKSSTPGSQATIKKTAGAITVSFVTLRDIKATGGATFTANNAIDLGNNTGWTINTLPSKNLYWIGNSGNWDDGNHWSITSGGTASGCSPTPMDNVFFDANSFSLTGQAVTVNAPTAYFNNMDWTGVSHNPALNGSTTIKIYGSLTLAAAMSFNFDGSINFEASSTGKTITTAGIPINTSITFNGNGGGWTLQDELTCLYSIYLNKGTLNTNNQTVNASAFWSNTTDTRALNAGTSTINLSGEYMWYIVPQGMSINASNSIIKGIATGWYQDFYGGGITYNDVLFTAGSIGSLYGNNTFHDASFAFDGYIHGGNFHDVSFASNATINGPAIFNNVTIAKQGDINGNNTFNNLSFSPGYAYTLQAGGTQTVSNICAQGTGALPIRIQSNNAGVATTISKASGTMCWDYVRVSDITGTGGAIFNAGLAPTNSEDMGGNTNLSFTGTCTPVSCAPCTSPSITAHPANSTICAGNNFVFAIGATGTGLTYQWQVDQGAGFTNITNTIPYSGVTTNTLNITAATTGLNGYQYRCIVIGTCAPVRTSNAATLTVNMPPTVNVNSETICSGQTATLTASGAVSYVWSIGGMMGDTTNPISVSPITTTTYTVTGITNGCSNTAIATVTVNPLPIITANSATVCSGQTATLTATGAANYIWSNGATTNSITVSPVTTASYTVTGTTNGCSNTAIAAVTVNPLPTVTVNSTTVCSGQTTTLTASGATSYTWSNGATTNVISISPATTTSYTVTGATNGCSNTAIATVTVNPLPTITVNSATVCAGQTATLTASGATNYTWSNGATTNVISVSPITTITYTVTGIINGCSNTAVATVTVNSLPTVSVNSATVCSGQTATLTAIGATTYAWSNGATTNSITVSPAATTTYTVTITNSGCSNTAIATVMVNPVPIISASVSSTTVIISATGGTPPYTGTGTFTGLAQGTYSYTVTDANGCPGSITVTINPLPISNFNISADTIYTGSSLIFTNISTGFSSTTKFDWNFGDICDDYRLINGPVSGNVCIDTTIGLVAPIAHTYNEPGPYTITLSAKDVFGNSYSMSKALFVASPTTLSVCNSGTNCDLVCNGGLENYTLCFGDPNPFTPWVYALSFTRVDYWSNLHPSSGTSLISGTTDYYDFHTCTNYAGQVVSTYNVPDNWVGCQSGHNNSHAYIGLITYESDATNYREYATSPLNVSMIANQYYKITYWVSLAEISKYATSPPSAYFTINAPPTQPPSSSASNVVSINPSYLANANIYPIITDKVGWTPISIIYLAKGGEKYVTLGNFSSDANTTNTSSGLSTIICPGNIKESDHLSQYPSDANVAYYYIDDISIVPVNPITVTASQTIVCSGQTVTLTASGGNGVYTWTSSTGTISSTASTINVTPTATTTYTVTSYNTTFGCNFSQNIPITVNPLPVLNTSGNVAICSGSSTTLTATGMGTFQWNTGATTSSITVSPAVQTTYTVTLTGAGGCKKSATIIVSVIPKPNFQVSGSATSCEPSSYAVTPTQPGVTYNWSTSTNLSGIGSSTFLNLNPSGGTITFTGTYGGCSSSSSLYVGSCCNPPNNNIPNQVNSTASALDNYGTTTGGVLKIQNKQFSINGIFHVNKNLKLEGCTVTMGYLAKIIVDQGFTLTITDRHGQSHLYACNEMWDGIYLPASSSRLIINNGTTIEDAINAVVSNSKGFFQISSIPAMGNVIFNKNLKSIVVNSALVGGHPGSMSSTTIQCYDGVTNGNPANTNGKLHYPHTTKRSDVGVEITSVFDITIGNPSNVALVNTFDNLDNGIRTYNSSVNVYNNNFKKISYTGLPNGECFPGIAICATGLNSFNRTLKVGSNLGLSSYRNTFFNCYRGVAATTYMNVAIWNNTFTNIANTAVRMTSNYGRSLTANRNTINYANIGIDSYDNRGSYITINDNVIADGLFASNEQGIRAGEIVKPSPPTVYNILNNVISNVRWGINASGLSASFINTNIVNIKHAGGQPCYGISLTNSTMSNVVGNVVKGQNKTDNWVNGIYLNLCNVSTVSCNTSDKLYTGLFFGGALGATSTSIKKNLMNNNFRGLMLSSAVVGQQGAVGSPNDNRWTNITAGNYHTYSLNSVGANSKFYVRTLFGPYRPSLYLYFTSPANQQIPLFATSGNLNSMTCPVIHSTGGGGGAGSPKAMALQIAGDSILPTINIASTKWMLKQGLYNYLQSDSSLVSTEPMIAQFKTYHSQHNLGKLQATEKILGNPLTYNTSALQTAQTLNNTVAPFSDAETNSQWMNSLLIDNALSSIDYTVAQLSDLRVLAAKCPYNDGTAVFQARTILSQYDTVDYINECEMELPDNQRSMMIQQAQDTINTAFKLYPNPNNGTMQLDYSLNTTDKGDITIYDIAGKLIYKYELDASASQIIISHEGFNNGIYFYRIKVNNKIVKSDKLIIIK